MQTCSIACNGVIVTWHMRKLKQLEAIQRWSGDMLCVTLNFDLSKIPFVHVCTGSIPILKPKIKHVHLLVLIWERLQTPTTTTTTTPDTTVQPLGRHIANQLYPPASSQDLGREHSTLLSVTLTVHLYQVCHSLTCGCSVKKRDIFVELSLRVKVCEHCYWDIIKSQKILSHSHITLKGARPGFKVGVMGMGLLEKKYVSPFSVQGFWCFGPGKYFLKSADFGAFWQLSRA